ncbi:ABC transporter permease [Schaalia sp. lx-260]|uniref:ABC transporter permease n=1 Tax=Schaalia sp. lx-260 TaxID=2899082 RepID=UPI001E63FD36|nr:FtsX-like permease family protein [Schaalia sp. lx-260]MCD4550223.1 hypothetical protein [Schaalia sp. lx-260]
MGVWIFIREVLVACRSQGLISAVVAIISAVSVGVVLGTAGVSAAAQSAVLSTVDQIGTRSVSVYSTQMNGGIPSRILDSLERVDIVESAVGFSQTVDVANVSFNGGKRAALRLVYGQLGRELMERAHNIMGIDSQNTQLADSLVGFATQDAYDVLALPPQGGGARVVNDGIDVNIIGSVALPEHLEKLTPTILAPIDHVDTLSVIYLSTYSPDQVPLLTDLVRGELRDLSNEEYAIETSQAYVDLRATIDGKLAASHRILIISVLGAGAGATMLMIWALVLLRRKDLGRRRALGASRLMILGLMLGQVGLLTSLGAGVGAIVSMMAMAFFEHLSPPIDFMSAVIILIAAASTVLSIIPALWAANRDPLCELRVP